MSFYVTGGTLKSDAPSYVEREADRQLYEGLLQGEFCYVLTARQMGKSSLMVRTADRLHTAGIHVVALDLTGLGAQNITPEQWYYGLLDTIGLELGLQTELEKFWQDNRDLGPLHCVMKSIRQIVLPRLQVSDDIRDPPTGTTQDTASVPAQRWDARSAEPAGKGTRTKVRLVIFVDEIDFVRSLAFSTDEFFAAIRECYNHRTIDSAYEMVTFCLLGVASPSDLIRDTRTTPFNIGRRIELNDFTPEEAASLARGLRVSGVDGRTSKRLLDRVLHWTNGHPYLTQRLCLATAEKLRANKGSGLSVTRSSPGMVDRLCNDLYFAPRARELDDNLVFVRERLLRSEVDVAGLLDLYRNVWRGKRVMDDPRDSLIRLLNLSGVVRVTQGRLRERNRIYGRVFDKVWARSNLPKAELRRQREAYLRGLVRATAVTTGVFLTIVALIALVARARHEATWNSLYRQAQANRASASPGQRFEALDSIRQASKIKSSPELTNEAIACLALLDVRRLPMRSTPDGNATALAFSDDLDVYASSNPSGEIVLRRVSNDREIRRWKAGGDAQERIWISRDKRYLAAAHGAGGPTILTLWRCSTGERLFALTNRMQLEAFDFHPESKQIAVCGQDGSARIVTLPGGETYTDFETGESCSVLRYDPDGRRLAIGNSGSLKVGIYDVAGGDLVKTLHSASPVRNFAWFPDGHILAAACEDRQIRLWEIEASEFAKEELPRQVSEITALAISRSGDILACGCADQTVRLWYGTRDKPPLIVAGCGNVTQLQFNANDDLLGLAGSVGMRFMEVASGEVCRILSEFDAEELNALDIHPDGRVLATAHSGGITFWDLATSRKLGRMPAGSTAAVRFHPVNGEIIDAEFRGTYCFDVEEAVRGDQHIVAFKPREDFYLGPGAFAVDFAEKADVLAVAYEDRVRLASSTNSAYAAIDELIGEPGFKTVAVSPDGRQVAAGNWKSGNVWIWNRSSGTKVPPLNVGGHAHVRFSPDGRWLATGTERTVTLWDTRSWKVVVEHARPAGTLRPACIAFAKNRPLWAIAWADATVSLLDMDAKTIANLESPEKQPLVDLAFTLDGSRLACATSARTVLVWDLDGLSRRMAQLGLNIDLKASAKPRGNLHPLAVEIGALDRLRFSQPKYLFENRREVADLTDLIKQNPAKWYLYKERVSRYKRLGEFENAVEDYRRWIELDRATGANRSPSDQAWPLRDLAKIYLFGPAEVQDYTKAFTLTREALRLEPDNPDNHFRHGVACYRLEQYESATNHLETSRRIWKKQNNDEDVAVALFYEAMCLAHTKDAPVAGRLLEQAKHTYALTDFEHRKSLMDQFPGLLWEAERVVGTTGGGG